MAPLIDAIALNGLFRMDVGLYHEINNDGDDLPG